jgi:hypothetical protein
MNAALLPDLRASGGFLSSFSEKLIHPRLQPHGNILARVANES